VKIKFIIFWFICSFSVKGNNNEPISFLNNLTNQLLSARYDSLKVDYSNKIFDKLNSELSNLNSPILYSKINRIAKVYSDDSKLIIFTWTYTVLNGNNIIEGIYRYIKDDGSFIIKRLKHSNNFNSKLILATLSEEDWFGALYYSIIQQKVGRVTYYTLLGLNPINKYKNIKIIDVARFDGINGLIFGASIFEKNDIKVNRIIFEYPESVVFMLKYQDKEKRIIFDHLSNKNVNNPTNQSLPDMSYDGLTFKKNRWVFNESIELRNKSKSNRKHSKLSSTGMYGVKKKKFFNRKTY